MSHLFRIVVAILTITLSFSCVARSEQKSSFHEDNHEATKSLKNSRLKNKRQNHVQLGPRPFFLLEDMNDSVLKKRLERCKAGPFRQSAFSIGHRGAPMQFPEHTKESYVAAATMGAGIVECDVTFTKDRELVCRHSQCDLHATTDILSTALASKCSVAPVLDADGVLTNAADIQCCSSDLTLSEFKTLKGKMEAANTSATSIAEYMSATPSWRTDLYTAKGTLLSHAESIQLFDSLGVDFTPELKSASVVMPFEGDYTQEHYAQQMLDEYHQAGIDASRVWPQSFDYADVLYWINNNKDFAEHVVYLDGVYNTDISLEKMRSWKAEGLRVLAPPLWMLLDTEDGKIVPSQYAENAKTAGLNLIAWSLERSGLLADNGGWYYQSVNGDLGGEDLIHTDGDVFEVLHVLAQDVGVMAVFSDWPATTTYYANCMGL